MNPLRCLDDSVKRGRASKALVVEEYDAVSNFVFLCIEFTCRKNAWQINHVTLDASIRSGRAPTCRIDMERLLARLKNGPCRRYLWLPGSRRRKRFGMNIAKAQGSKLFHRPCDGSVVIGRPGKTRADSIGEFAIIVVRLTVNQNAPNKFAHSSTSGFRNRICRGRCLSQKWNS